METQYPFIHQVTENAIWQNGFILPKPFYYLGQYSIVIFLAHLLQISVELIDKLLLPLLLAISLPYMIYSLVHRMRTRSYLLPLVEGIRLR